MVKFTTALYEKESKVYSLVQLDKLLIDNPILQDLHCLNCGCLLTFHHSGVRKAYLSTKSGEKHSEECNKKVLVEEAKERHSASKVISVGLTKTEQARLAKSGYNSWMKRQISSSVDKKTNPPSKRSTSNTHKSKGKRYSPVAAVKGKVENDSGVKRKLSTRTPIVSVANISRYIGQAIKVVGQIVKVKQSGNKAYLYFKRQDQIVRVLLNESTFMNSAVGLKDFLSKLSQIITQTKFIANACAVVDVIVDNMGNPLCVLRTEEGLNINGRRARIALQYQKDSR